mgnify:CR=1 FL=1
MPTQVQFRRGTASENNAFTGAEGELSINTADYTLRLHDGSTVGGHAQAKADLSNVTGDTDDISEGSTNLYFTNARVDAEIDSYLSGGTGITVSGGAIAIDFTEFNTDNVTEGSTNLYFTDARAQAALTAGTGVSLSGGTISVDTATIATKSYVDTEVANVIDSAPGALDTLNELAAALGDDANFSTTITNNLALKANLAGPTFTGSVTLPATTSIGDVSNLEIGYLNGVTSAIQTQLNAKAALAGPALTGTPTAPTASTGTNTTQIATTAFVQAAVDALRAELYAYTPA